MKKIFVTALLLTAATPAFAQAGPVPAPYEEEAPMPAPEDGRKFGGLRIEAQLGIENAQLSETDYSGYPAIEYVDDLFTGAAYGGEVGFDIPVSDSMTVGPYVSYQLSNSETCEGPYADGGFNIAYCITSKSNLSVGARIAGGRGDGELYLTLGYDVYDLDLTGTITPVGAPQNAQAFASTDARKGGSIGFGYNHNLNRNFYLGGGLHISGYGDFEDSGAALIRGQARLNLGARF